MKWPSERVHLGCWHNIVSLSCNNTLVIGSHADCRKPFASALCPVGLNDRPGNLPDGQISGLCVQPSSQKYFGVLFTQITSTSIAIPHPQEGRIAIVTDVGRGRRWTRLGRKTNGFFADGEVVWS